MLTARFGQVVFERDVRRKRPAVPPLARTSCRYPTELLEQKNSGRLSARPEPRWTPHSDRHLVSGAAFERCYAPLLRTYVDAYSSPLESAARGLTAAEKRETESKYSRTTFPNAAAGIVERLLNTKTAAYPDATPARGRYPVILFAAGGGGHR